MCVCPAAELSRYFVYIAGGLAILLLLVLLVSKRKNPQAKHAALLTLQLTIMVRAACVSLVADGIWADCVWALFGAVRLLWLLSSAWHLP